MTIAVDLDILTRTPELLVMEASYPAGASPPPPHYHPSQDEHFEVLEGAIALKVGHARSVVPAGESFDIPRGTEHKPSSQMGASILMFEPSGTLTVGDHHDPIPGHVDSTTGHAL